MAGFLPEHLPLADITEPSPIGHATRSMRRNSVGEQSNAPAALVSLSKRQNTLIERRSMLFKLKSTHKYDDPRKAKHRLCRARERQFYRCDIHAVSSEDERAAQVECKQLVVEAGGSIVDNFEYLGGFLFELSPGCVPPIETGDATAKGGSIVVEAWQPFLGQRNHAGAFTEHTNSSRTSSGHTAQKTIDSLFGIAKRRSMPCVDGASSSVSLQDWEQEGVTWMEVLREGQEQNRELVNGRTDLDDAAEWVTLSDASEFDY